MATDKIAARTFRRFSIVFIAARFIGCGAQGAQQPSQAASNSAPAAGAQPADLKVDGPRVSANGCTVDIAKFCQATIDRDEMLYNGEKYNWTMFAQNFPPHTYIYYPLTLPNGDPGGEAECYVATQQRKVMSARLMPQPPVTAATVEYAKSVGVCEEQNPDYSKIVARFEENALSHGGHAQ